VNAKVTTDSHARDVTEPDRSDELRRKIFGERAVYDNEWIRLVLVDIETPDGNRFEHHVVRLQTVVLTIVINDENRFATGLFR
jgi:hypothetical protein